MSPWQRDKETFLWGWWAFFFTRRQRDHKELFIVALSRRQNNVALSPSLQGAISGHYGKETKKHFFEGDGPSVSLGWQRDKATFLWGGGLSSLDKGPRVRCLHTRSLEASKVILKAQRFCKFWSTLGFGGCRHANLITVSFKWEPPGAANFVKKAHWALVVTDTGTWYQYFIIENPQVLRILGKSYLGVWWLQTRSLDITIF